MAREDAFKVEGKIVEVLPNTLFRVELSNGHRLLAHIAARQRKEFGGMSLGDRVKVMMSPYDLSEGCILIETK